MEEPRVVITGVGTISPLGHHPKDIHAALCENRVPLGDVPLGDEGRTLRCLGIQDFDATQWLGDVNLRSLERTGQFSIVSALLALEASGWTEAQREGVEMDLILATALGTVETISRFDRTALVNGPKHAKPLDFANTVINAAAGQTAIWHQLTGSNLTVCAGKTSGLRALGMAARRVRLQRGGPVLTGAVEALSWEVYSAFQQAGQLLPESKDGPPLPLHRDREGFLLGEAGAYLMVEDASAAATRSASVLAEISGWSSTSTSSPPQNGSETTRSSARAIEQALSSAKTKADAVDLICVSANGSSDADSIEMRALADVFQDRLASIPLMVPAASFGETLGASGLLQSISAVEAARAGCVPGTPIATNYDPSLPACGLQTDCQRGRFSKLLCVSQGFDGDTAAMVFTLPPHEESSP